MAWLYQIDQIALVRSVPWTPPLGISCQVLRVALSRTCTLSREIALKAALSATRPPTASAGRDACSSRAGATAGTARGAMRVMLVRRERRASMMSMMFCVVQKVRRELRHRLTSDARSLN